MTNEFKVKLHMSGLMLRWIAAMGVLFFTGPLLSVAISLLLLPNEMGFVDMLSGAVVGLFISLSIILGNWNQQIKYMENEKTKITDQLEKQAT